MASIDMLPSTPSALVIDAVKLNRMQANKLRHYGPRILISPVFNRADMVTHALVRAAPPALQNDLPDSADLRITTDYAFATAHGLRRRMFNFEKLQIGLCLSGGVDPMEPNSVLTLLDGLGQVVEIVLIDRRRVVPVQTPLRHVSHVESPWNFLKGINVFIGGDGVMLAEAIAQGLPAISLSRPGGNAKNAGLVESGALRVIARDATMLFALGDLLGDRAELEEMHRAAIGLNGASRATRLAQDIRTILEENA